MHKIPVTIIIPTYKRLQALYETIISLNSGNYIADEILVIDQNESIDFLSSIKSIDNVKIINVDFKSSAKARNIGILHAKNEILIFCDDDVLINTKTIFDVWTYMMDSDVALVTSESYSELKKNRSILFRSLSALCGMSKLGKSRGGYVVKHTMLGRYEFSDRNKIYHTEWAMGYFFAIKKTLLYQYNCWFDEVLYSYSYAEDLDFTLRYCRAAKLAGKKTFLIPKIYVKHLGSQEYRIPSDQAIFFYIANRYYLLHKNFPNYSYVIMNYNNICMSLFKKNKIYRKINYICKKNINLIYSGKISELETILRLKKL